MTPEDLVQTPASPSGSREVRILGLDVGEKRIGLAVSDPLGITAQGLEVWLRQGLGQDLAHLVAVAKRYGVQEIVVGLPRHMNGHTAEAAPAILELAHALEAALGVKVHTWDERLTTVEAERLLLHADVSRRRRRQVVDKLAAVLILQAFLDHRGQG
jgi:putative Holliday junction resolvase